MSSRISDIAKKLDKKPSVIMSILKEIGINVTNMNASITEDEVNRLYLKLGIRIKKKAPIIKKVVEEKKIVEQDNVIKKRVTIITKKQVELHNKEKAKTGDIPKKKVTVIKKDKKVIAKKVQPKPTTSKLKEKKQVAPKVEVKKEIPTPIVKKVDKVDGEPPRRYVKIDKDEIYKNRRDYGNKNKGFVKKPDFRKSTSNTNTFNKDRKPMGGRPTTGTRPGMGNRSTAGKTTKDETIKKPKITKNKKTNQKKDFNKSFNNTAKKSVRPSTTGSKSKKYRSQTFIPGVKRGVNEVLSEEFIINEYYSNDNIRRRKKNKKVQPKIEVLRNVKLPEIMTVKLFAEIIKKQTSDVIMKLMTLDVMASINDEIDFDTATLIADEYNIEVELDKKETEEDILFDDTEDDDKELLTRPPVVVVMGHVDHGKTSLLDAIRKTNVVDLEAGSITQHIGAYIVEINDKKITFLDTPGHQAFTSMRKRGAQVTDIAIIVVAADDGIMPQTIEAINHAKAAEVEIIIAINKIDTKGANIEKVKQELTEHGLVPEEWGGETVCVPVSAMTGENLDGLLEMINLSADMLELKANPNKQAKGTIIESRVEKGGIVATMLVKRGTLKVGDAIISGIATGRIKAMQDDKGKTISQAGPSVPVEILGMDEVPEAGDEFYAVDDLKTAKSLAERRKFEKTQDSNKKESVTLEDLFAQIQEGQIKDLNIIVKGDVKGSVEAVTESLVKITNDEVQVKVIHGAVGQITEHDVSLAELSNAIIIGFNIRPTNHIVEIAKEANVDIRLYRIIYKAIEDIEAAIKGMLTPKFKEVVSGHAEIREIFKVSGIGTIAGCMVIDGKIERNSDVRVVRDGVVVYEGKLASLKRFKDDAKEVSSGYECGMSVEKFNDIKQGDVFETFKMEEIKI